MYFFSPFFWRTMNILPKAEGYKIEKSKCINYNFFSSLRIHCLSELSHENRLNNFLLFNFSLRIWRLLLYRNTKLKRLPTIATTKSITIKMVFFVVFFIFKIILWTICLFEWVFFTSSFTRRYFCTCFFCRCDIFTFFHL